VSAVIDIVRAVAGDVGTTVQHNWPFLLASVVTAAVIQVYVGTENLAAWLRRRTGVAVLAVVAVASLTPFCSCGTTAVVLGAMASAVPWAPVVERTRWLDGQARMAPPKAAPAAASGVVPDGVLGPAGRRPSRLPALGDALLANARRLAVYFLGFATLGYLIIELIPTEALTDHLGGDSPPAVPLAALLGVPVYLNADGSWPSSSGRCSSAPSPSAGSRRSGCDPCRRPAAPGTFPGESPVGSSRLDGDAASQVLPARKRRSNACESPGCTVWETFGSVKPPTPSPETVRAWSA